MYNSAKGRHNYGVRTPVVAAGTAAPEVDADKDEFDMSTPSGVAGRHNYGVRTPAISVAAAAEGGAGEPGLSSAHCTNSQKL